MYSESELDDIDYKVECLLIKKFKLRYEDYCQDMGNNKLENIRGSIINKLRNSRELFDKLSYFQKIYLEQLSYVDDIFSEWPYEVRN